MDCKKALKESGGDLDKAATYLREKGIADASKRSGRSANEGLIYSYIHPGDKLGVMVELNCETDFVARNEEFKQLARDLAMHVAAAAPLYTSREEVPANVIEEEKRIYCAQAEQAGKPAAVLEKIAEGKLEKFFSQICLLEQQFIKDMNMTIEDLIKALSGKLGENVMISRFVRFKLGENNEE